MNTPSDHRLAELPADLPVPLDDGACGHLPGSVLPAGLALPSTAGREVEPAALPGRTVLYVYPMTGRPGAELPEGWNAIPGARGCTPESCAFRDLHAELLAAGAAQVFGLSTQDTDYQREAAERLHLPFELLSDSELRFARALRLPTFKAGGPPLINRLTLIVDHGRITHCFYPIFPPDRHADEVLAWLREHRA